MVLSNRSCYGQRFRLLRLAMGKTVKEMAAVLNVTVSVYRASENRKENQVRTSQEVLDLCSESGVDKYWLMQGIGKIQDQELIYRYIKQIAVGDVSERIVFLREFYGISAKEILEHTAISSYYTLRRLEDHKRLYDKAFIISFLELLPDPFTYDSVAGGKKEFIDRLVEICDG